MIHQMSTTSMKDEFVLNCTCTPTGTLFIGSKEDRARNMVAHQEMAKREREAAKGRCTHRCMQGRNCGGCGCEGCGYSQFFGNESLEQMTDLQLEVRDAEAREALTAAYGLRVAIIRERERRGNRRPVQKVTVVSSAEIAAEPGAPLDAGYWIAKQEAGLERQDFQDELDRVTGKHECTKLPFDHSLTMCLRATFLTDAQRRLLIRVNTEGPLDMNGRATSMIEALEAADLVDVDWDADLDLQKSRLRWHIKVTAKEVE